MKYVMGEAEDVINRARMVGLNIQNALNKDGATADDVREAAADLDDIEATIERLLADG